MVAAGCGRGGPARGAGEGQAGGEGERGRAGGALHPKPGMESLGGSCGVGVAGRITEGGGNSIASGGAS